VKVDYCCDIVMKKDEKITEQWYVPMIDELSLEKYEKEYKNFQNKLDNEENFETKCKMAFEMLSFYDAERYTAIRYKRREQLSKILFLQANKIEEIERYEKFLESTRIPQWEKNHLKEMELKKEKLKEEERKLEEERLKKLEEENLKIEEKKAQKLNMDVLGDGATLNEENILKLKNLNKVSPDDLKKIQTFLNKRDITFSSDLIKKYISILNVIHKKKTDPWVKFLQFYCELEKCKNPDIKFELKKDLNKKAFLLFKDENLKSVFTTVFLHSWIGLGNVNGFIIWKKFGKLNDELIKKTLEDIILKLSIKSNVDQYIDYFLFELFFIPEDPNSQNLLNTIFAEKENKKHILFNFNLAFDFCIQARDYKNAIKILDLTGLKISRTEDFINPLISKLNKLLENWRFLSKKHLGYDLFCLSEKNIQRIRTSIEKSNSHDEKINDFFLLNAILYETRTLTSETNSEDARRAIKFFESKIESVDHFCLFIIYSAIAYQFGFTSIANELAKIAGVKDEFLYDDKKLEETRFNIKKFNRFRKDSFNKIADLKETEEIFKSLINKMEKIKKSQSQLEELSASCTSLLKNPSIEKCDQFMKNFNSIYKENPDEKEILSKVIAEFLKIFIKNKDQKEYQLTEEQSEKFFKEIDFILFSREELLEMLGMFNKLGEKFYENYLKAAYVISAYDEQNKVDFLQQDEYRKLEILSLVAVLSRFCSFKKCTIKAAQQTFKQDLEEHFKMILYTDESGAIKRFFIEDFSKLLDENGHIKWEKIGDIKSEPLKKELQDTLDDVSDRKQCAEYGVVGKFGYMDNFLGSAFLTPKEILKHSKYTAPPIEFFFAYENKKNKENIEKVYENDNIGDTIIFGK
jgi:hypothetical protein